MDAEEAELTRWRHQHSKDNPMSPEEKAKFKADVAKLGQELCENIRRSAGKDT